MKDLALLLLTIASLAVCAVARPEIDLNGPRQLSDVMTTPLETSCDTPETMTAPPPGAIVVDASGKYYGSFRTVTQGVANIPNTTNTHTLFIFGGRYNEQVVIPSLPGPLVIQGQTCRHGILGMNLIKVTITHSKSSDDISPEIKNNRNRLSSTVAILSQSGVKVYNIKFENTARSEGRAGTMFADGSNIGFYTCEFVSARGAVTANSGFQLYAQCTIQGMENLITGMRGLAWFHACTIVPTGAGWITANGNDQPDIKSEFVIDLSTISSDTPGVVSFLGRPWGRYARTVFQNCFLDSIDPRGWKPYENEPTDNVYFKEFGNRGPSAATNQRVAFSGQLKEAKKLTDILGPDVRNKFYYDGSYFFQVDPLLQN